jgi:hypothetical protein
MSFLPNENPVLNRSNIIPYQSLSSENIIHPTNDNPIIGVVDLKDNFQINSSYGRSENQSNDRRLQTRGKMCSSYTKIQLLEMLGYFGIYPNNFKQNIKKILDLVYGPEKVTDFSKESYILLPDLADIINDYTYDLNDVLKDYTSKNLSFLPRRLIFSTEESSSSSSSSSSSILGVSYDNLINKHGSYLNNLYIKDIDDIFRELEVPIEDYNLLMPLFKLEFIYQYRSTHKSFICKLLQNKMDELGLIRHVE